MKKLFEIKDAKNRTVHMCGEGIEGDLTFFESKMEAKKYRDELNSSKDVANKPFRVVPSEDHWKSKR